MFLGNGQKLDALDDTVDQNISKVIVDVRIIYSKARTVVKHNSCHQPSIILIRIYTIQDSLYISHDRGLLFDEKLIPFEFTDVIDVGAVN